MTKNYIEEPLDKDEDMTVGGIKRHVTSTSWNNAEYLKLKKMQQEAPADFLRNNLSSFIKFLILE